MALPSSEYSEWIWVPLRHQTTFFWLARPTSCEERRGSLQFLTLLFTPATLWTPADPREPHQGDSSAWASGSLTPSPSALSRLTGLYQAWGIAVSLAARRDCLCTLQLFRSALLRT